MTVDRFATLLYGIGEAAAYLSVPPSTLTSWAYGYERHTHGGGPTRAVPVITAARPAHRDEAAMPFIGLRPRGVPQGGRADAAHPPGR
jgi:hypothetical protein